MFGEPRPARGMGESKGDLTALPDLLNPPLPITNPEMQSINI